MVKTISMQATPAEIGMIVYRIVSEVTGIHDPYKNIKQQHIAETKSIYPELEKIVANSNDKLLSAIRIAILMDQGELRVIIRGTSFGSLLAEAFDQIRQNAAGNVAVMSRMLDALQTIASLTASLIRRRALREQVECIAELADRTIGSPHDRTEFVNSLDRVREAINR